MLPVVGVSALLVVFKRTRAAGLAAVAVTVGMLFGCAGSADIHSLAEVFEGFEGSGVELELLEDSRSNGFNERALVSYAFEDGRKAVFQADLKSCKQPLYHGDRIKASTVRFEGVDYSEDAYSWREGACGKLSVSGAEPLAVDSPWEPLRAARAKAIERIGAEDDSHALLQALVCGYRRNISGSRLYDYFKAAGLAHFVAVSGAHLVIVTGLFASALKALRVRRQVSAFLLVGIMASFLVLSGAPVSAVRAAIMSSVGVLSLFARRRPSSLNALGLCMFCIVGSSPASSMSVSFALSALSTLGIVLFSPLLSFWLEKTPLVKVPFALDALSLTFSASLLSMPYACSLFSALSFVSPVSNVVCAPLFPVVCGAGLLAGVVGFLPGPLGGFAVAGASWVASALCFLVEHLAKLPYAAIPFSIGSSRALFLTSVFASSLWFRWPRPSRRAWCVTLMLLTAFFAFQVAQPSFEDQIVALDVGQGDAVLVRSAGKTLLVDTGNQPSKLLRELGRNHITRLDAVLVTHADDDHYGCMDVLELYVEVDRVILAEGMTTCDEEKARDVTDWAVRVGREVTDVRLGDEFAVGRFDARVVWPREFSEGSNADSLCVLLEYDGDDDGAVDYRALMTGDAEKDELAQMLDAGLVGDIDILKVGHHGSRNGSTLDEMRALHPEIALISCGAHNRYGHPTQEILDQLDAVGAATFRTDRDGEIRCTLTPERVSVAHD